jgi:hypothetical protein
MFLKGLTILMLLILSHSSFSNDNSELASLYAQDQAARELASAKQIFPSASEERKRRFNVFEIIANGELGTATDYIRALIVLQHTNLTYDSNEKLISTSSENHLLAFQLAKRAHQLGHEQGLHFLVWTYNYFAVGVGCDAEKYGFDLVEGNIVARDSETTRNQRIEACGWFDPIPTYTQLDVLAK